MQMVPRMMLALQQMRRRQNVPSQTHRPEPHVIDAVRLSTPANFARQKKPAAVFNSQSALDANRLATWLHSALRVHVPFIRAAVVVTSAAPCLTWPRTAMAAV
jgi:hypothetical protein